MNFYKNDEKDQIWMVDTLGSKGEFLFSFDKKSIFNFFTDYPDKLSDEQIEIFKLKSYISTETLYNH